MDLEENTTEKRRRLATLLGQQALPTRTQLVKDLVGIAIAAIVKEQVTG